MPVVSRSRFALFSRRSFVTVALVAFTAIPCLAGVSAPSPAGASPAVYVVSPHGNDAATGAADAPFRTLSRALSALSPGSTLLVRGGEYVERVRQPAIRPGTSAAPIRVVAVAGETPVVRGILWLAEADHWTIDGISVTWSEANAPSEHMVKMSGGTGWRITRGTFSGARSYAALLVAGEASGYRIDHNVIRDTHATNGTNQDHLVYINAGLGGGVLEHNVLAHSPNGRGVKVGPSAAGAPPLGNVIIRNNTFFDNGGPSNIQLSYGASGTIIERNVFQRPQAGRSAVTAYELHGADNVVRDNAYWESEGAAVAQPGLAEHGNFAADPRLVAAGAQGYRIGNPALAGYGAEGYGAGGSPARRDGYRMLASDGGIFTFGDAVFHGSTGNLRLNRPIVSGASTPSGAGYWLVASDGGIFTFGDAGFHGSGGSLRLRRPITAMAATPTGNGYWLVEDDGTVHSFGDAVHHGNGHGATGPVIGIVPTASGGGYWIAGSDGRVASRGDAAPLGSTGPINQPIVGISATTGGRGYRLVARDGGVFTFGDAAFHGSTGSMRLNQPIVGMASTPRGYRLVAADGGIFTFGDAAFLGSTGAMRLNSPVISFS